MKALDNITVFPTGSDISSSKNVKFGIDPTFPDLHLGHLVPLRLVKKLKNDGMNITIVLGTFTAQLGDPSGKEKTRPILSAKETEDNANKILDQVTNILGDGFAVFRNGDLFNKMSIPELLTVCSRFTVNHMLSRDAFQKRTENGESVALHELIVPICQGLDSVHLNSDIEIGGTDQLFNFQIARKLQEQHDQDPEICLMTPIIHGTDGRKMSKSLGNCVFLSESPKDIFGKCMSISDQTMEEWIPLLVDTEDLPNHPLERKKAVAFDILQQLKGEKVARKELEEFESVFQNSKLPEDIVTLKKDNLLEAVVFLRKCSRSEARRLLGSNAVKINNITEVDENKKLKNEDVIKVGKRHFGIVKV